MYFIRAILYITFALALSEAVQPILCLSNGETIVAFGVYAFGMTFLFEENLIPRYQKWNRKRK